MSTPSGYTDEKLIETLSGPGAPPAILTTRADGEPVYVALGPGGDLIEEPYVAREVPDEG